MRILSLSLIVVVIASIVGLGWVVNQIYLHSTQGGAQAEAPGQLVFANGIAHSIDELEDKAAFIDNWQSQNELKLRLTPRDNFPLPPSLESAFASGTALVLESESGLEAHYLLSDNENVLSIELAQSQLDNSNVLQLILTLGFYSGVTLIILIWVWPLVRHLMVLRNTAKSFGSGDLNARLTLSRLSYIRDIEEEFNRMAEKIQSLVSDNKLLSRAVSHDLKTPLARLRFGFDALTETESAQLRQKYASRVNSDLEEMESLIETLLQYARLDESRITLKSATVVLPDLVQHIINSNPNDEINVHFDNLCDKNDHATVVGDHRYLQMLVTNIFSNAQRHANSSVLIELRAKYDKLVLIIEDDGEGIPDDEREHAVKPFWRGSQSREHKGHGMGLAIVARIAEWHGARLSISKSKSLGGASIFLEFERANHQIAPDYK